MPNIKGYQPLANPDWISLEFDDGSVSNPVSDPTGEYRKQVDQVALKLKGVPPDPMAAATASLGGELSEAAGTNMSRADVPAPLGAPAPAKPTPMPAFELTQPAAPAKSGAADGAMRILGKYAGRPMSEGGMPAGGDATQPPAPQPTNQPQRPPPGMGGPAPLVTTGSTSSWQNQSSNQRSSSGLSEADRPRVDAANEEAIKGAEVANQADYATRAQQGWQEWGRLNDVEKRKLAEKNALEEQQRTFEGKLDAAYRKFDEDAARPIDPAQAFAGEKRWYAFMAGFGDVIRNVGAALAGKGPVADPGKTLDDLVERSVQIQMAQKEQDLKAGRLNIDRYTSERETVRHKLGAVITQLAQNELDKAHTKQEYAALGAVKAKGDAIVKDARAKAVTATARQETVSQGTTQVTGGSTERQVKPAAGDGASLDQLSKLYDLEKKKLELHNAQLDQIDAEQATKITGVSMSPQRLEKLRAQLKENAPVMAKLDSFMSGIQTQLEINGATFDRNTGEIKWPEGDEVGGVGYGKLHEMGPVGAQAAKVFNTKGLQLKKQQEFLQQLVTNDVTGAVSTLQQDATFREATGGDSDNPEAYKQALQNLAKFAIERRNGLLTPLGTDGIRLYRHNEQQARKGLAPSTNQVGTLPLDQR